MPLSHLTLTVSHLPTSTSFFLSCLQPLGYQFIGRHDDYIGFGQKSGEPADFWITEQKPGSPAGAAHVAFPAPSKDAVGSFFISALKAGAKIHGEPKTRDTESGYYSAAVIDFDGNSIEAVYRPGISAAKSEVSASPIGLLENGSVVSRASTKVSSVKPQSIAPSVRSEAKSCVSRATTAVERVAPSERTAPTIISREVQQAPSPTYIVNHTTHTTQKKGRQHSQDNRWLAHRSGCRCSNRLCIDQIRVPVAVLGGHSSSAVHTPGFPSAGFSIASSLASSGTSGLQGD